MGCAHPVQLHVNSLPLAPIFTITCTCCYDESKGIQGQDLISCSFSDSPSCTCSSSSTSLASFFCSGLGLLFYIVNYLALTKLTTNIRFILNRVSWICWCSILVALASAAALQQAVHRGWQVLQLAYQSSDGGTSIWANRRWHHGKQHIYKTKLSAWFGRCKFKV